VVVKMPKIVVKKDESSYCHSFEEWVVNNFKEEIFMQGRNPLDLSVLKNSVINWLTSREISREEAEGLHQEAMDVLYQDNILMKDRLDAYTFPTLEKEYRKSLASVLYRGGYTFIQYIEEKPAIKHIEIKFKLDTDLFKGE